MQSKPWLFVITFIVLTGVGTAQDARSVLEAADRAMGARNLKSIQYSGSGWTAAFGQSHDPAGEYPDWPRFEMPSYTRTIDYEAKSAKEELTRRQGSYPPQGGGGTPIVGEQRQAFLVSGNYAWNMQGNIPNPNPSAAEQRQLEIWLSPHGFVKAGLAASNPTAFTRTEDGVPYTIVSFTLGKYRINGTISSENLVERVQTWVPNPVLGDMIWETNYIDYKDYGGVKFPTRVHHHQGDAHLRLAAHGLYDLRVTGVQVNPSGSASVVPDAIRQATNSPVRVESTKLADGVWFLGGGSHNSVLVEFRDYAAVIEAPLNEERSLAVMAEVKKLVPNKRIKYLVNTHHHFDHSGGLRTYVSEGTVIITSKRNREYYENVVFTMVPRTLQPDRMSLSPRATSNFGPSASSPFMAVEAVEELYTLTDGTQTMEIHYVRGLRHSENMLMVYLPKQKIVVEADLFNPPASGAPPAAPNPSNLTFYENIKRLKLDVAQIAPLHGRVVPMSDFLKVVGKSE